MIVFGPCEGALHKWDLDGVQSYEPVASSCRCGEYDGWVQRTAHGWSLRLDDGRPVIERTHPPVGPEVYVQTTIPAKESE